MRVFLLLTFLFISHSTLAQSPTRALAPIPSGDETMFGTWLLAEGIGPHPTAILLHGHPGSPVLREAVYQTVGGLALPLWEAGFNVLAFNFRGSWGNGGRYSFDNRIEDVEAALVYVRESAEEMDVDASQISVIGHSAGGWNALIAGIEDKSIACTVGVAPGGRGSASSRPIPDGEEPPGFDNAVVGLSGYTGRDTYNDLQVRVDPTPRMNEFRNRPLLIIEALQDAVVPAPVVERYVIAAEEAGANPFEHVQIDTDHNLRAGNGLADLEASVIPWITDNCK
ncbi:MAG: alpha/beta fold hydrolase [Gammaproteobacteria bacterium]